MLVLALTGGASAGCTAQAAPPTPVRLADPAALTVIAAADPATRALATSRALFATSPGVVVAPADDAAGQVSGASTAVRLHVPMLLFSRSAAPDTALDAEVRRLHCRWYVGVDGARIAVAGVRRKSPSAARPPARVTRHSAVPVAILAKTQADPVALATVEAAGARVVPGAPTGDVTASPAAITALHAARSAPVLLIGSAFHAARDAAWAVAAARTGWQLPGGGQRPFANHRFVALYGTPGAPVLGALGAQDLPATVSRVQALAAQYRPLSRAPVVPALELIATVASGGPGPRHDYSNEVPLPTLARYVDAAARVHISVILDLQPGRADFLSQAEHYRSLLERPGVGLALDPEWRLGPHQLPLRQIGSVRAAEVNRVSAWLAALVKSRDLPPKMFVLHQFRPDMLPDRASIVTDRPELDVLIHVDGQGTQPDKQATWRLLHVHAPSGIHWGWKNFLHKDHPVLTPTQTMRDVHPAPTLITYQ